MDGMSRRPNPCPGLRSVASSLAFSANSLLNSHHLSAPTSSPPLRHACFMLSTKVHPALLLPGTDHRACTIPQACTPAPRATHRTGDTTLASGQPGRRLASFVQVFDQINAAMLTPRHGGDASRCHSTVKLKAVLPAL